MPKLFRILVCSVVGALAGVLIWGAIVKGILFLLDQQHGEGFAHIPAPFLGWLALFIGGLDGAVIGAVAGYFAAGKILRSAAIGMATTLAVLLGYYLIVDPGISLLISSPSFTSLKNLTIVAAILSAPSPVIGAMTAFIYKMVFGRFENVRNPSLPDDLRGDAEKLIKTEDRADEDSAD